jgi:hypothetical protein
MLNDRLAAARMVAEKLAACEDAIDDALSSAAELTSAAPAARRRANVSPVVGQDAIALTGEAMAALHAARAKIVAAHHAYAEIRDEIGLSPRMMGDMWKLPIASLTVVESDRRAA